MPESGDAEGPTSGLASEAHAGSDGLSEDRPPPPPTPHPWHGSEQLWGLGFLQGGVSTLILTISLW